MRGSFSFDLLLASFILMTILGVASPNWSVFVKGVKQSVCSFLKEEVSAWHALATDINGEVPDGTYMDSWILVKVKEREINVWDGGCE